jgi:hypothetical protein
MRPANPIPMSEMTPGRGRASSAASGDGGSVRAWTAMARGSR